jgi:solute carrier family 35 protein F5
MFALSLIPISIHSVLRNGVSGAKDAAMQVWKLRRRSGAVTKTENGEQEEDGFAGERLLASDGDHDVEPALAKEHSETDKLSLPETARLSLEFCMLWFLANYFASACLEYTSVGSVTILTSTSSVWTLIFCAVLRVEGFTIRKLVGVLASMAGVVLISSVDLSGSSDENRGNFPHKTQGQIAIGDAMAFVSAIIYGVYVTVMKRKVGNEDRVNMPLFFGLVGLFNVLLLWPGFILLHFTGVETVSLESSFPAKLITDKISTV